MNQLVSKEERNKLMKQFQEWDTNGDGVLSREEIFSGYKNLYGEVYANEEVVCYTYLYYIYYSLLKYLGSNHEKHRS